MKTPQVEVEMLPHNPISLCSSSSATNGRFKCSMCIKQDLCGLHLHLATVSWVNKQGSNPSFPCQNTDLLNMPLPPVSVASFKQMLNCSSHLFPIHEYLNISILTSVLPPELPATCFIWWFECILDKFTTGIYNLLQMITAQQCTMNFKTEKKQPKTFYYSQTTASGNVFFLSRSGLILGWIWWASFRCL